MVRMGSRGQGQRPNAMQVTLHALALLLPTFRAGSHLQRGIAIGQQAAEAPASGRCGCTDGVGHA